MHEADPLAVVDEESEPKPAIPVSMDDDEETDEFTEIGGGERSCMLDKEMFE